jgi:selenocysteine lyase/cysteine desulfurase
MRRLFGVADASRIVFTLNATAALNLAIQGAGLVAGDLMLTTVAEHNSVLRPAEKLRRERGIEVEIVGLAGDGSFDEDWFQRALARRPRLVVVSHASNVTGRVFPIRRLFGAAKDAGALTVLDAAQSLGLLPVLPEALNATWSYSPVIRVC